MVPGGLKSKRCKATSPAELLHLGVSTLSKSQDSQGEQRPVSHWSRQVDLGHAEDDIPPPHPHNEQICVVPLFQRRERKSRGATSGVSLARITKAMGARMPISVLKGNRRPHDPLQAAKFTSEAAVVVRSLIPIFPHWKHYQRRPQLFRHFMERLSMRLAIDSNDKATKEACVDVYQSSIRQRRFKVKQEYYKLGASANQIRRTSPFSYMNDTQWLEHVQMWSSPENKAVSEQNKRNRAKVKYHHATGSRCYIAHLHALRKEMKETEHDQEVLDEEHAGSNEDVDAARESVGPMQTIQVEQVADGQEPMPSVYLLKIAGTRKSSSRTPRSELSEVQVQLAAQHQRSAVIVAEVEQLKRRTENTERELEEFRKQQREDCNKLRELMQRSSIYCNGRRP